MLKVKNLTLLSKKEMKKGGNFDHGCKKKRALLIIINWVMAIFSPQPLKKWFFIFFRQSDPPPPPPRKSQNVKMRNFCNGF